MNVTSYIKNDRRCRRTAYLAFLTSIVLCGSAQAQTDIWLRHYPAHPGADENVWVTSRGQGENLKSIAIDYDVYELIESEDGIFPNSNLLVQGEVAATCEPDEAPETFWCRAKLDSFGDQRLIRIRAKGLGQDGNTVASESYAFASGSYPGTAPIPIRRSGPIESRLDVVLVPERSSLENTDSDRPQAIDGFVERLSSTINDLFFSFGAYGGTPGHPYRRLYNFYYTEEPGQHGSCASDHLPASYDLLEELFDAVALLHCDSADSQLGYVRRPDKACLRKRDYKCGGGKIFMTSEIDYVKTIGHEMGHLLHGLTDEYCGRTLYSVASPHGNVFEDEIVCKSKAAKLGYDTQACAPVCASGNHTELWKIDHPFEPSSVMGNGMHQVHSRFFNESLVRILHVYADCTDDNICDNQSIVPMMEMAESEEPDLATEIVVSENVSEYQELLRGPLAEIGEDAPIEATISPPALEESAIVQQLEVKIEVNDSGADVIAIEPFRRRVASDEISSSSAIATMTVVGIDADGQKMFEERVADPRWVEIEGESWELIDAGSIVLPLPNESGLAELVVEADFANEDAAEVGLESGFVPSELHINVTGALTEACTRYPNALACD